MAIVFIVSQNGRMSKDERQELLHLFSSALKDSDVRTRPDALDDLSLSSVEPSGTSIATTGNKNVTEAASNPREHRLLPQWAIVFIVSIASVVLIGGLVAFILHLQSRTMIEQSSAENLDTEHSDEDGDGDDDDDDDGVVVAAPPVARRRAPPSSTSSMLPLRPSDVLQPATRPGSARPLRDESSTRTRSSVGSSRGGGQDGDDDDDDLFQVF